MNNEKTRPASVPEEGEQPLASSYIKLLRANPNFRCVWLGEVASSFGDWFNLVATATLVEKLTGSGGALGVLFAVRMLAPFLASIFAGVLADRHSRRKIMIVTDLSRALVVLCFLLVRTPEDVWLLYALTAIQLGLSGLFSPARSAILPDIVPKGDLGVANALSSTTYAIMQTVGAAAGGLLAGIIGLYETFIIDAATFVLSALLVMRVRLDAAQSQTSSALRPSALQLYAAGLDHLRRDRELFMLSMQKGLNAFFITGGLNIFSITLALRYFPIGEAGSISVGLVFCATGLGTAIGPVVARLLIADHVPALRYGLFWCYIISAAGLVVMAPALSFAVVLAGLVIRGMGGGTMFVFSSHLMMLQTPAEVRGRVFASEFAIRSLLGAAGAAVFSLGVDSPIGVEGMLWLTAGAALVPACIWGLWLRLSSR